MVSSAQVVGLLAYLIAATRASASSVPSKMRAMQASGIPCSAPDWPCLTLKREVPVPVPGTGELLIAMRASSISPLELELVEPRCKSFPPHTFNCSNGTVGLGGAGVVMALGSACHGLAVGDAVWGNVGGEASGSFAEYTIAKCQAVGLKPKGLSFAGAGASLEGITSLQCLQMTGAPWKRKNLTVAITSGQGGTGTMAIQLAKALGATRVITAATSEGIDLVKRLGADVVVDYHEAEMFDKVPDDSVDIVFDNLGHPGTADKAMHAIRSGGTFLVLVGGGGDISKSPKKGVRQLKFFQEDGMNRTKGVDALSPLFDSGALRPAIFKSYSLADVPSAFTRFVAGGVFGKIAVLIDHKALARDFAHSPSEVGVHV